MSKKKKPKRTYVTSRPEQPVTFRSLTVDFEHRIVTMSGRKFTIAEPYLTIPLLEGVRVLIPTGYEEVR